MLFDNINVNEQQQQDQRLSAVLNKLIEVNMKYDNFNKLKHKKL